ncbi:MAG: hypothetical protein KJ048_12545 [Dehalococcoidia bacterium]|nr:hypothetical protein [Dehalococcoidia bacterium]
MIIRLMGEGQWRVDEKLQNELNNIDAELDADAREGDGAEFARHLVAMHELIQSRGERVAVDELVPSEAMVPPRNITLEELRELIGEEGLIPG